jgi:hypothetical protein
MSADPRTPRIDVERLRGMTDDTIDFSEIARTTQADWDGAELLVPIDEETYREFREFLARKRRRQKRSGV